MNLNKIKIRTVVTSNDCWIWQKSCCSAGYGQITENKKYWLSHRYAYACVSDLKSTDVVRHKCHNPKCCNPDHLEVGSHRDNWHDSAANHAKASSKMRKTWMVLDNSYGTVREASTETGLTIHSLIKYTVDGVFQVNEYRKGCKEANVIPKV